LLDEPALTPTHEFERADFRVRAMIRPRGSKQGEGAAREAGWEGHWGLRIGPEDCCIRRNNERVDRGKAWRKGSRNRLLRDELPLRPIQAI
jgi:hypothetical protein